MKLFSYIGLLFLGFLALYLSGTYIEHFVPTTLTSEVVEPDILLSNSKRYFQDDAHERSMKHLIHAIEAIEKIEQEIDDDSKRRVDLAVVDLKNIYAEMSHDTFNITKLNEASVKALNALTYAELKVSEHYVESHELNKARIALGYGMLHIKNALLFAEGRKKEYEVQLYAEIDSIVENNHLSDDELIEKLEHMIAELDEDRLIESEH